MKKLIYLSFLLLLFASCENNNYVETTKINRKIIDLQVDAEHWKYSNKADNNYYFASFSIPELTTNIYNNGIVAMYIENKNTDGTFYQTILPSVRHKEHFEDNKRILYTETIDYEFSAGNVVVFVTVSDFVKNNPGNIHFLLKMMW